MEKKTKKILIIVIAILIIAVVLEFVFMYIIYYSGFDCPNPDEGKPIPVGCVCDEGIGDKYFNKTIIVKGSYNYDDECYHECGHEIVGFVHGMGGYKVHLPFTLTKDINASSLIEGKEYYFTGVPSGIDWVSSFYVSDIQPA